MLYAESDSFDRSVLPIEVTLPDPDDLDNDLIEIFHRAIRFAQDLLAPQGAEKVRDAYLATAEDVSGNAVSSEEDLREVVWTGYHPAMLLFRRLEVYGVQGYHHYSDAAKAGESAALCHELELASQFYTTIPSNWLQLSDTEGKGAFGRILQAAQARYALDTGKDLTVDQVTILAGVNRRSVQNALSKQGEAGLRAIVDPDFPNERRIPNSEAKRWLSDRRGFQPTRPWHAEGESEEQPVEVTGPTEYVFLPVAEDMTAFRPAMRRNGGYQIGPKGEEEYVEDYFEALNRLQAMRVPRWRRPNEKGNWGIVTGTHWTRVPLPEILSELKGIRS